MIIVFADEAFMAQRPERLPPGWWIVDEEDDRFFDGPYDSQGAALERLREISPFG